MHTAKTEPVRVDRLHGDKTLHAYLLIEDWMLVASDEATAGSVIAKQLLISPLNLGKSHCCFCSGVPYLKRK